MVKKVPMRTCLGCRESVPKQELIRVVKSESDGFFIDETGKANGRGAYIHKSSECLKKAIKSHGLDRSFKMTIPAEIYDKLSKEMSVLNE